MMFLVIIQLATNKAKHINIHFLAKLFKFLFKHNL